jgi:cyclomaltodextrinase / maltogenic alpha-amylase / neopullulanase
VNDLVAGAGATPEWVRDAVFYQIFPDRFASSAAVAKPSNLQSWGSPPTPRGFQGGDLVGIVEHLDYLQDLGITALYLNPVFQSTANHRYHTHDYFTVDPLLGGNGALELLLREGHERGMRVVLDGVFNHASRGFFQFNSILENGQDSPYLDWFQVYSWPLHPYGGLGEPAGYAAWWDNRELPKFKTSTQDVREFLWNVARHWVDRGIDGWRLDVPNEINDDVFWQEFRRQVKGAKAEAYIVGEIWGDAARWLQGDQFDAVMNYIFTRACLGFFAGQGSGIDDGVLAGTGLSPAPVLDAAAFAATIESLLSLYSWDVTLSQLNLLGSHDTPRFRTIARGDTSSYRLATLFQMTFPGAPCIYYGDEVGMEGGHDPDNRRAFDWNPSSWDEDLRTHVRACIALRKQNPVLREGAYTALTVEAGVYAFARSLGTEVALVAINASSSDATLNLTLPDPLDATSLRRGVGECIPKITGTALCDWKVPARTGCVVLAQTLGS